MPTTVNDRLLSWGTDPATIRQAEKTARLPIVEGRPTAWRRSWAPSGR